MKTKKIQLFTCLILLICFSSEAQHHIKNEKFLNFSSGITGISQYFDAGYDHVVSNKLYGKVGIGGEFGDYKSMNHTWIYSRLGMYIQIWACCDNVIYFNGGGGILGNYHATKTPGDRKNNIETFNFGGYLGIEAEGYLTNSFAVITEFRQVAFLKKDPASLKYFLGAGIRWKI